MKMDIEVTYLDGSTVTVAARQIDIVRLEKYAGKPWVKLTGVGDPDSDGTPSLMMDHVWHMAFTASRRANADLPESYDAWCDLVDSVLPVGTDDGEVEAPLAPTPSPGE